ncbi:MAG: ROK family protein [Thermomicrobiales bacterium]
MSDVAIALDVGGTMIKAAAISRDGEVLSLERLPTPHQSSPDCVADRMLETVRLLLARTNRALDEIAGIGVSIAAFITAEGIVIATAHLSPEWVDYDLRRRLTAALPTTYYFALDTPAPTLGEAFFGAGRGVDDFAYVTVSTGIGAGVIAGGRLITGGLGWAGGIGHVIVDPNGPRTCDACGNRGCLETYAAKQGILALADDAIRRHPDSKLARNAPGTLTPQLVCDIARAGDEAAIWVFGQAGFYLGLGLTSLVDILSPKRVVVGGGIGLAGDLLLDSARAVIRGSAYPPVHREVEIVPAALGDLSGVYGVAAMVFHDIRINRSQEA